MLFLYAMVFLFGIIIGSFLNVCACRIPSGMSLCKPRSHCTRCGYVLKPYDLVPVLSYVFLGGRCRRCKSRISVQYPLVELASGTVFLHLFSRYGLNAEFFFLAFLMSLMIVIFVISLEGGDIPGRIVVSGFAGAAAAVGYHIYSPLPVYGAPVWWSPLAGLLPAAGLLLVLKLAGALAGMLSMGNRATGAEYLKTLEYAKVFAFIGVFAGWRVNLISILLSYLFFSLYAAARAVVSALKPVTGKERLPFGPFIAVSTYIAFIWGGEMVNRLIQFL